MQKIPQQEEVLADLIIINGNIITVDKQFSLAQAVAVKNGKILAVGSNDEVKSLNGKRTQILDLQGRTLLPGINDSHIHASLYGGTLPPVVADVSSARSIDELLQAIQEKIQSAQSGEWVRGIGLDTSYLSGGMSKKELYPTRWELDKVSPDNPVYIGVAPFHGERIALLNSRGLELTRIGRDSLTISEEGAIKDQATGELTGLFWGMPAEARVTGRLPPFTREQKKKALLAVMKKLNSLGITSITEPSLGPGGSGLYGGLWDNECIHLYNDLANQEELTLRVSFLLLFTPYSTFESEQMNAGLSYMGMHTGFGNEWLRIAGLKLYADGIPPMKTAWMSEDYPGGGNGKLIFPGNNDGERSRTLSDFVMRAHNLGFQIGIHATGDKSIAACVDSFVKAETAVPKGLRHYIIHGDFTAPEEAQFMAEYDIGISVQPALAAAFSPFLSFAVGKERAQKQLSLKALISRGVHVAGGSDAPVINPDWRMGIQSAVLREGPNQTVFGADQKISLPEAIRMYTIEGAWQDHMEKIKGSVEVGKLADFCVLDDDILAVDAHRIKDIPVSLTIAGGKIVHGTHSSIPDNQDF